MKRLIKVLWITVLGLIVVLAGGFIYFEVTFPKADPPMNVKVEITEARLERGKYLVEHVVICTDCHSTRDWTKFSGPVAPGTEGMGGFTLGEEFGLPGKITSKNITPAGLSTWSDGEIIRAITTGVTRENEALFPIMPFYFYNNLSEEDLYSIVAYIKSLKPIENQIPERELNFPFNLLVNTLTLESYTPKESIDKSDKFNYGKYITTIAICSDCHTPMKEGEPIPGMDFAGGAEFNLPWGIVRPANLTPDKETGIGNWTKEDFIKRFKNYDNEEAKNVSVTMSEFNSVMPWTMYAGMSEEDLGAIYDYLMTQKPVKNRVEKWTPPKQNLSHK
jgi:hypothetical protein